MNYGKYLCDDVLAFWIKHGIDDEYGGIYKELDRYGNVISDEKNVWFLGRSLWSFAKAYRTVESRSEYLTACDNIYKLLARLDKNKLPFILSKDGGAITIRDGLYHSEAHAVMGLAEYYRITKNREVLALLKHYFDKIYLLYTSNMTRSVTDEGVPIRKFGLNFFIISVAQAMRGTGHEVQRCNRLIDMAIDEIRHGGYVKEDLGAILETVKDSGEKLSGENGAVSAPGQDFEAAWFILAEAEYRRDDDLRQFGKKLCDLSLPDDFDTVSPFVPVSRNIDTDKYGNIASKEYMWWPQCEAILTYRLAHSIFGEDKYRSLADHLERSVFNAFADWEHGEWYFSVSADGKPCDTRKGAISKGAFHLPRMLMILDYLSKDGNISKYYG